MDRDRFADPRPTPRRPACGLDRADGHGAARVPARKQPQPWLHPLPIGSQNLQEPRRQHRVPVPAALAVLDVDQHSLTVDRTDLQADGLANTQSRRVGGCQYDAIAQP